MYALVTGAAGFVGSHLTRRLLDDGFDVVGLDSLTDYYDVNLKRANIESVISRGMEFVEADLNDVDLDGLLENVQVVFHLAGQPGVRSSWGTDFTTYTRANIDATQRLLEAAKKQPDLKRVVYASSSSVYGNAERYPTNETDRPQPVSPYGVTKLAAEHLCCLYAANFGVPTVSLRFFTVYGPGQRPDMAFTRFTKAALHGEEIPVFGSGNQIRDFTYVDDVVEAVIRAATKDVPPGTVLNVAGGSHTSIKEVLQILEELMGSTIPVKYSDAVVGDVTMTGGDTTAIRSMLGWEPSVSLRDGISRQLKWASEAFGGAPLPKA